MKNIKDFEVIIIGGSYAGLSAAMALGRALRNVLVIDSGKPCNRQTPHSHNFITQDGKTPKEISTLAKTQVQNYPTVTFYSGIASSGAKTKNGFKIITHAGDEFFAKKLIFATGIKDIMPEISGFAACWGISVIHCPYCHGYEYKSEKTGILANGDMAFEMGKLISNWTKTLTIFTNGKSTLSPEQTGQLEKHHIKVVELPIEEFKHQDGQIEKIVFKDNSEMFIKALYARPQFEQHCDIAKALNCEFTPQNHIEIDAFQKTSIPGIFACGDNATMMRSVANAVAMGGLAGVMANRELTEEAF